MENMVNWILDAYIDMWALDKGIKESVLRVLAWGLAYACFDVVSTIANGGKIIAIDVFGAVFLFSLIILPINLIGYLILNKKK